MRFLSAPPRSLLVPIAFIAGIFFLTRCDMPTSGPSFETPTRISAPIVFDKTFTFLGGPTSKHEPLVDTTSSTFDSLFTVDASNHQIFLDQEVTDFNIGSLRGVFDDAESSLALDTILTESVLRDNALAEQSIHLQSSTANPVFESAPLTTDPIPVYDQDDDNVVRHTIPADQLLGPPNASTVGAQGATVESATFTDQSTHGGQTVNTFTFTLTNDLQNGTLTDGDGSAPVVALETADGTVIAEQRFPQPIAPQSSGEASFTVANKQVMRDAKYRLTIDGTSAFNPEGVTLATSISTLRHRQVTLSDVDEISLTGSQSNLSTQGETETQFVGIEVQEGSLTLAIHNDQQFPIVIDELQVTNDAAARADLPASFPEVVLETSGQRIAAKSTKEISFGLAGTGIANTVDVTLKASVAPSENTITVTAGDEFGLSADGHLSLRTLHFRPSGEQIEARGVLQLDTDQVTFRSGDYVELDAGMLQITSLVNELGVGFDAFTISFPGVRQPPYARGDSLVLRYEGSATTPGNYVFRRIGANTSSRQDPAVSLGDLRVMPGSNQLRYHVQGRLPTSNVVRSISVDDQVSAQLSLREFDFREVAAHVNALSMNVTDDVNGDGLLDVADPEEAERATFDDLDGVAERLDGLNLQGSTFTVSIETNVPADTRLYAVFRGKNEDGEHIYLKGKSDRSVPPSDTMSNHFAVNGAKLNANQLIQMDLEGVPPNETMTRTVVLDNQNSNVDAFISELPTHTQFVGKALLLPTNEQIRVRPPLTVDAGLNVSIPLSFRSGFAIRDTVNADLSSLGDLTDPGKDVTLDRARLLLDYANQLPVGVNVELAVVDEAGSEVITFPGNDDTLQIEGAPQTDEGTAASPSRGTLTIDLNEDELRSLSEGRTIRLRIGIQEESGPPPARLRATDTITFDLRTDIDGTVSVGN